MTNFKLKYRFCDTSASFWLFHKLGQNSLKKGGNFEAAALAQFCEDIPVTPEKLLKV